MSRHAVSVVIPTWNGADTVRPLLERLRRQQIDLPTEIVVVDSGSTDDTVTIANDYADRVLTIPTRDFNHGLTRNLAIRETSGDLIVLIVQDALPASDTLLRELVTPMLNDDRVSGTFARQTPRPGASALTRHYLAQWLASSEEARRVEVDGRATFDALAPMEQLRVCAFDNVCSCIRRTVWETHPFPRTAIAEDLSWGRAVLLAGGCLVYAPKATVVHSHDRPVRQEFARTRTLHRELFALFGLRTIRSPVQLGRAILGSLSLHLRLEGSHPTRLPRALGLAVAWPCGQYLGGRDGESP